MAFNTIIKIAGIVPAAVSTDGIAQIDIPEDGEIMAIGGIIQGIYEPVPAAGANVALRLSGELSFLSISQVGINDSRGAMAGIVCSGIFFHSEAAETGAGGCKLSETSAISFAPEGIEVNAGERVFIHGASSDADLTANLTFLMYIKTKGGGRRSPRRR